MMSPFDEAAARPILDEPSKLSLPRSAFASSAGLSYRTGELYDFLIKVDLENAPELMVTPSVTMQMNVHTLDFPTANRDHEIVAFLSDFSTDERLLGNIQLGKRCTPPLASLHVLTD
jgi:hypothetical protein